MPVQIPPIETLQEMADELRAEHDPTAVEAQMRRLLVHYDAVNFDVQYQWPLWRARPCPDSEGYPQLSDLHHPPPEKTPPGRMNRSGEPLLYVSLHNFTTFSEIGADSGHAHLVGYVLKSNSALKCVLIGEHFRVHRSGYSAVSPELAKAFRTRMVEQDHRIARSEVYIDALFANIFSDPRAASTGYLHSQTLAKLLFEAVPAADAIYYPSVAQEGAGNFAIKSAPARDKLAVCGTCVVKINRAFEFGIYDFEVVKNSNGFYQDGTIQWEG